MKRFYIILLCIVPLVLLATFAPILIFPAIIVEAIIFSVIAIMKLLGVIKE